MAGARAYVELLRMSDRFDQAEAVHLVVQYDGKEAHIELPVREPQRDGEPGVDAYRRELAALLQALQEVAASPEGIYWPFRR
jgi:hypothetical protein